VAATQKLIPQPAAFTPPAQPQYIPPPQPIIVHTPVYTSSYQQVIVQRPRFNHLLHFALTLFTCGFWLPIWIICWLFR
jgi:hypothetical protein